MFMGKAVAGVNVKFTIHVFPAATVEPFVQVVPVAIAKSAGFVPPRATVVMCNTSVPPFVTCSHCPALRPALLIDTSRKSMPVTLRPWLEKNRAVSPVPQSGKIGPVYVSRMVLKRSALPTTETELKLMAAAAIIGLRRR